MKSFKNGSKKIFWGFILITAAVLIVLDALGIVPNVPFVKLTLGAVCLSWLLKELFTLKIHGIVFPAAFIFMLFEREIGLYFGKGENLISNWLVLLVAVLLSAGLGMIFGGLHKRRPSKHFGHSHFGVPSKVNNNKFAARTIYIDCADFKHESLNNSFGACEVYFQNADLYDGDCVLEIENKFGAIEIYVPSDWEVVCDVKSVFGATEQSGGVASGGKVLTIKGFNRFGAVEIYTK